MKFFHLYLKQRKHIYSQGKGTLFRNIQNTGRWHYSALGSSRGSYVLVGSYVLIVPFKYQVLTFMERITSFDSIFQKDSQFLKEIYVHIIHTKLQLNGSVPLVVVAIANNQK